MDLVRLSNGADNLRETPPYLRGASDVRVLPEVKAQADAVEIDRSRPAGIILALRTKVLQTTGG